MDVYIDVYQASSNVTTKYVKYIFKQPFFKLDYPDCLSFNVT